MQIKDTHVTGFDGAFQSMREPFLSFDKSDSIFGLMDNRVYRNKKEAVAKLYKAQDQSWNDYNWLYTNSCLKHDGDCVDAAILGPNDLKLAHTLLSSGSDSDGKFTRYIHVQAQITAPVYFLQELDTYKVATVRNSSSIQHIGAKEDYSIDDFAIDRATTYPNDENNISIDSIKDMQTIIDIVNKWRQQYKQTKDYRYFRIMRQLIPMGYQYTIAWDANYQVLRTIYSQRIAHPHRLIEWTRVFADWIRALPYASDLITYGLE